MAIRVLLADDHKLVREGLRALIGKHPDMEVIAEAEDGRTAVRLAQNMAPDIVIMDVAMPGLNGIEATRQLTAKVPGIKVLALSMYSDRRFVLGILKSGASGYLLKDCAFEELRQAINAVARDQTYLSPTIVNTVVKDYIHHSVNSGSSAFSDLTAREREVLQLLAEGRTVKEIAYQLNVSVKTIETHRQQVMNKLGTHSLAGITKYAIREGLTTIEG